MTHTEHFNKQFEGSRRYLFRHFRTSWRGRLALLILGEKAADNLLYDAAQVGWGIKQNAEFSGVGKKS